MLTTTKKLNEVTAQLDKVKQDLEAAETLNKELQTRIDELVKINEDLKQFGEITPEVHQAVKDALAEAMTELEQAETEIESVEARAEQLESQQEDIETAISEEALQIVASQGVPPVDVKPVEDPAATAAGGDLMSQLNAIKDPVKQRAFWLANKETLMDLLQNKKSN